MKKIVLFAVLTGVLLSSCNTDVKEAGKLFQRAELSFSQGDFSQAKLQIDSIRTLHPKAVEIRKAAVALMQQIDLSEQRKTLSYLDSMMVVKQASLDSVKGRFVLEKDTAYQETGNYFYPTQVVEKNIGRTFLRAQVNERGEMSLTSIYCAGGAIHHTAIKVTAGEGLFAQTNASSDSYETTDLGRVIEKADYKVGSDDGGVAAFIVANRDKKNLRLEFIGDRTYRTVMTAQDITAVAEIYHLARILSGMEEIRKEQREANLKIKFVNRKIDEAKNH